MCSQESESLDKVRPPRVLERGRRRAPECQNVRQNVWKEGANLDSLRPKISSSRKLVGLGVEPNGYAAFVAVPWARVLGVEVGLLRDWSADGRIEELESLFGRGRRRSGLPCGGGTMGMSAGVSEVDGPECAGGSA